LTNIEFCDKIAFAVVTGSRKLITALDSETVLCYNGNEVEYRLISLPMGEDPVTTRRETDRAE
jgi:hypothetical protein